MTNLDKKWNIKKYKKYGINLEGSHSPHVWGQALTHLEILYERMSFDSLADIGCGYPYLDIKKIPCLSKIENIIRVDGNPNIIDNVENIRICNLNKEPFPLGRKEVDFAISFEVIEHMYSTYGFLSELDRITKLGFMISKPNTDYEGLNSKWYGETNFYNYSNVNLFDNDIRHEHINFIPNYELFGFGKILNYNVFILDQPDEEIQFFLFLKNI